MSPHDRDPSPDKELILRPHLSHSESSRTLVPMWDSSDPERAPPPLPMNPGSTSPTTKANVSPNVQAVAASFREKLRENAPSPYTTNPMPRTTSPDKSLIKGQYHKRMQSMPNSDPRSEFLNYLESKSSERSLRSPDKEPDTKLEPKSPTKAPASPSKGKDADRDTPSFLISNRYLSKPILGESTPPSATMLALQNMQLPADTASPSSTASNPFFIQNTSGDSSLEALSAQILSLTNIASSLQREMAQLSRRSKDNATDLVSLKAATNARDEDIRKSLRDLSSNIMSKFSELDASTRWDQNSLPNSGDRIDGRALDSSPCSKKSFSMPRMTSPCSFSTAMERELCASPAPPISDGSASIALLEKVLREMATKEGQEKLLALVDEMKSRATSSTDSGKNDDSTVTRMLEEILNLVKERSGSKALVRTATLERQPGDNLRSRSLDAQDLPEVAARENSQLGDRITSEILSILNRVKASVTEGGGLTNEVKALVRELRGEVLGMGRDLARKLEALESHSLIDEDKAGAPSPGDIAAVVDQSLHDLREQMKIIVEENREHRAATTDIRAAVDRDEIYAVVKKAISEMPMPEVSRELPGVGLEKEEILETVREAWETYKPEIELQNFGLERDEILECLSEGLKAYQPRHEQAVTYDQVLAAVEAGMQNFVPPPVESNSTITRDEIILTIRECLENSEPPAPRGLDDAHLGALRDELLNAVTEAVTSQSSVSRTTTDSGIGRDEILSALSDGLEAHYAATKEIEEPRVTKDDIVNAVKDVFAAHQSALTLPSQSPISMDEIRAAVLEAIESQGPPEIELNRDDLMEAISSCLQEASNVTNANVEVQALDRLQNLFEDMKEDFKQYSAANGKDTEQVLDAVKDGLDALRKDMESVTAAASADFGKHEIMDTVKEGLRLLQADMEKTIHDAALSSGPRENPNTPELLDAMEKEFEHLRQTISTLLLRGNASSDKDEILDAIRDAAELSKGNNRNDGILEAVKEQFETLRETLATGMASSLCTHDKDEIIAAFQEHFDALNEQSSQSKDGGESVFSATNELLDAFHEGVDSIRGDLERILNQAAQSDHTETFENIRDGLHNLKAEMEALRESHRDFEETSTVRGRELVLGNESTLGSDIESLKTMISQLQSKVDGIESNIHSSEASEDVLKKEHLTELLANLEQVQGAVAELAARPGPSDETFARKEDTDAIETLLHNTKAQLEALVLPNPDEIAKAEQVETLEAIVMETKEAVGELSARIENDGPTKSELGTLESLLKDMWIVLDELKTKATPSEDENTDKLSKSDLQTVEAMIFDVKTQVEELKLPDVDTLPTKTEVQELAALVTEFREKFETESDLTAQAFDARKAEHGGLAEKIEEAKTVMADLGEELKSKLDGSGEGLSELKQVLEGLVVTSDTFATAESIKEMTDLINREFERARGEQEAAKLETEERDASSLVKHDETRAAIIVELSAKIDERLDEMMAKYEEAKTAVDAKFAEAQELDMANLEAATSTKSVAEDLKLVIGAMDSAVTEACERISVDTQTFFEKVDRSYTKMEEMHNRVQEHQQQARADYLKAAAATERVESKLGELHPELRESIQEVLSIVRQHYEHSQQTAQDVRTELSAIPSAITPLLPALPPPDAEKPSDREVQEKLDTILEHAANKEVQAKLDHLLERSSTEEVHEKLDTLLQQTTKDDVHNKLDSLLQHFTNAELSEKLNMLLEHSTDSHGKLDRLLDHATAVSDTAPQDATADRGVDSEQTVAQMMKLDEMHKDIMETSRKMTEMFETQSRMLASSHESYARQAEEAAIALERRVAQREQVEAELVSLTEEKNSMLKMIQALKAEKDELVKQNTKLSKELSGVETALELRREEMTLMEERADSLEKRILEGVLEHARSVLLSRPSGMQNPNFKRVRRSQSRQTSATSNASAAPDTRSLVGSGVGIALKRRGPAGIQQGSLNGPGSANKERRILSLSHVTGNRGVVERPGHTAGGFANLKRSHSVKSHFSRRKASWGGRSSVANKENEVFVEEDEQENQDDSDTGTERRTSYASARTDNTVAGPEDEVHPTRPLSVGGSVYELSAADTGSVTGCTDVINEAAGEEDMPEQGDSDEYPDPEDDFETTVCDDDEHESTRHDQLDGDQDLGDELAQASDFEDSVIVSSALGTEITSST